MPDVGVESGGDELMLRMHCEIEREEFAQSFEAIETYVRPEEDCDDAYHEERCDMDIRLGDWTYEGGCHWRYCGNRIDGAQVEQGFSEGENPCEFLMNLLLCVAVRYTITSVSVIESVP